MQRSGRQLFARAGMVSGFLALGVLANAAVDVLIAARFGLGTETDAFFIAFTLPVVVNAIVLPATNLALVPAFARESERRGEASARHLFLALISLSVLISLLICVLLIPFAGFLMTIMAPGSSAQTLEMAARLGRVLFLGLFFLAPNSVMRAYLHFRQHFSAPAMMDALRGIGILTAVGVLGGVIGIDSVAWGFSLAALAQCLLLIIALYRRTEARLAWVWSPGHPGMAEVRRLFVAPLLDRGLMQLVLIAERFIGSFLPVGSISALSYGRRITSALLVVLSSGIGVVTLPSLSSSLAAEKDSEKGQARETLMQGLRFVSVFTLPLAFGVSVLSTPLIRLVFERGAFDARASALAGSILGLYVFSVPFHGHNFQIRNYLYASTRALKLILLSLLSAIVSIGLGAWWSASMGAPGMALAFSIAAGIASLTGYELLRREDPGLPLRPLASHTLRVAMAAFGMAVWMQLCWGWLINNIRWTAFGALLGLAAPLLLTGLSAAGLFWLLLRLLRVEEAHLPFLIFRRLRRILSGPREALDLEP